MLAVIASNPPPEPIIHFERVTRQYTTGRGVVTALHDATFSVARGEWAAIVGPSGSGKSTLMNLLAGIDRASAGEVWVNGQELTHLSEERLARWRGQQVGIVFQFFQLMPTLTAIENVVLPMELRGRWRGERRRRALTLLERVGVADLADSLPSQLSGGEQQRVAIARALANDPAILLADEPTGNLDSATGERIIALLAELADGERTLLIVTHDARLAARAPRTIGLADGVILQDTSLSDAVPGRTGTALAETAESV
ncbi:MAG: ABC transporter ATP-binding protein [Thermomicrobia bacterium]|nr:ABC transporter ATP-binding protein [Thermomicrobia bacterium]